MDWFVGYAPKPIHKKNFDRALVSEYLEGTMTLDAPNIAIIGSIAFFYLKYVYMQWRKARSAAKKTNVEIAKARKQGKSPRVPEKPAVSAGRFAIQVVSWYVVGISVAAVFIGLALNTLPLGLPAGVTSVWWVLVAGGILALSFGIK
jgi:hypothetical protein